LQICEALTAKLMKIDLFCPQQHCNALSLLFNVMFFVLLL